MEIVETKAATTSRARLREEFLTPYRKKGDPFESLLARSTYLTKYCRGGESWTDTICRVVEGNAHLAPGVSEAEMELLFHLFWTGQSLPPGRGLWTGGVPGIPADARFNCFSGSTRFWANGTLVSFEDAVGQTVEVLAKDGQWRPAKVQSFGTQRLFRYLLKPPGRTKFAFDFVSTAEHRWFTSNRGEVTDLRVGDKMLVTPETSIRDQAARDEGFAHGFIFGDGSKEFLKKDTYRTRLCGEKAQHGARLKQASIFHNDSKPPSFKGDPLLFFKSSRNLKELPSDDVGFDYLSGFLDGWVAADGSVRSNGCGGNRLSTQNKIALDWVVERAPLLGYCVTGRLTDFSDETNLGSRTAPLEVLTLTRNPVEYTVRAVIDEGCEEEVFCVVEPETRSFTLEGGVVTGNCWFTTLYSIDDWCWTANQLMLGGGVGVGLSDIDSFPAVSGRGGKFAIWCANEHPNFFEVAPEGPSYLNGHTPRYVCEDSREGWIEALRRTLTAAFKGSDLVIDVSGIRARGKLIRTFGGTACGPGPLAQLLRAAWNIVRGAAGRKLSSVEALDITNHIGLCIKAGNVRRSALIVLGQVQDREFRDAKKDGQAVKSHRHTSNNSIVFQSWDQIENFNWDELVEDNIVYGEPGILNLPLGRKTDPGVLGVNPCGEVLLHDRESCNLAEVFPAKFEHGTDAITVFRLVTRYCLRQRLTELSDPKANAVQKKTMRLGVGLGGICDFDWTPELLAKWYGACRREADDYADELGVIRPIAVTTVKPSGTTSLLNGSDPGIHAAHANHYLRRVRIAKNDPMAPAMMQARVPYEEDQYDTSGHTWVFAFPMKSDSRVTKDTETIRDQLERQATVQEWWSDNAVSATISFDPETERAEMAQRLKEYVPRLKSTALLPKVNGYVQAPYETIDAATYREAARKIDHASRLVLGGDIEVEECAGGACPIR